MNASLVVERGQSAVGRFVPFKGVALGDVLEVVLGEFQDAWSHAIALPFPEQRDVSVGVVAEARAILATTAAE